MRPPARYPAGTKISGALLAFAEELLADLPPEKPEAAANSALLIAVTAWNAVVWADSVGDPAFLERARQQLATGPHPGLMLFQSLVKRKRERFADDERAISNFTVIRTADGINVRAEARDPFRPATTSPA